MRLAQSSVQVNVVGDDKVGTFDNAAGYILYHEQDAAEFIRNTQKAQALAKEVSHLLKLVALVRKREPDLVKQAEAFLKSKE